MTAEYAADIAATNLYMSTRIAETITATPRNQWGDTQCVAWMDGADKRCTRNQSTGFLCKRHHQVALNRLSKQFTRDQAARVKAARKRAQRLPALREEAARIRDRIHQLDPDTNSDTASYVGEVHPSIRRAQQARLTDARVTELARLVERLRWLDQQIGDQP